VPGWVCGGAAAPEGLQLAFRHLQFERLVTRGIYVNIQRFYVCAERGQS
jgi:hypothetical protein